MTNQTLVLKRLFALLTLSCALAACGAIPTGGSYKINVANNDATDVVVKTYNEAGDEVASSHETTIYAKSARTATYDIHVSDSDIYFQFYENGQLVGRVLAIDNNGAACTNGSCEENP